MGRASNDLELRIWFTLGALVVGRLGTYIPLPGIDTGILFQVFRQHPGGGILGMFDMLAGGGLGRMSIFALGLLPYIAAAVILRFTIRLSPRLKALERRGEAGRKAIHQYMRYGTVLLCAAQSYGIALALESTGGGAAIEPGALFRAGSVITLTAGTVFLAWLAEQITRRGIGNGIALIIFSGIVANLPPAIASTLELGRSGALNPALTVFLIVMSVGVIAVVVFMERAQRRIAMRFFEGRVAGKNFHGGATQLPLKLNTAGIIPPIFAVSLLLMTLALPAFPGADGPAWLIALLGRGQPLHLGIYAALIVGFAFFYARILFDPVTTAEYLEQHGGFIPTVSPGQKTGEYLSTILTRLTTVGAAYLALVCVLPEILLAKYAVPFHFGGLSLLILASVAMETIGQIHARLRAGGGSN